MCLRLIKNKIKRESLIEGPSVTQSCSRTIKNPSISPIDFFVQVTTRQYQQIPLEHLFLNKQNTSAFKYNGKLLSIQNKVFLTIKTKILGERLRDDQFEASVHEVPDSPRIAVQIARSEPLVSRVKEWEQFLFFHHIGYFFPLFLL